MLISTETKIKVPFHDVDSMNVAWHGHYVKYLEIARCELLDKIGYGYNTMREHGHAWPIVDMRIKYIKPVEFTQDIIVKANLVEWENRIKISYEVLEEETRNRCTKAHTIQMAIDMKTNETLYESPKVFLQKMERFLKE